MRRFIAIRFPRLQRLLGIALALALALGASSVVSADSTRARSSSGYLHVTHVDVQSSGQKVRVALYLDGELAASLVPGVLSDRIYVDLTNTVFPQGTKRIAVENSVVRAVRIAQYQYQPTVTRVTFETLTVGTAPGSLSKRKFQLEE